MNKSMGGPTRNPQGINITRLTPADLAAAARFTALANWNQTENDWRRLLMLESEGCFAARGNEQLIGTTTAVTYGTELAWIGMVLVVAEYRRCGIGMRLMCAALDYLQRAGVATVKLDATPAGQPLYESLGFIAETQIERWEAVGVRASTTGLQPLTPEARPALDALDRLAFGVDRRRVLDSLMTDSGIAPLVATAAEGQLRGYALARRGAKAFYIGPLIATDGAVALDLLDGMLNQLIGEPVYLDFHVGFGVDTQALIKRGFVKQRGLLRMCSGQASRAGTSPLVFAIAGPEIG